jgi:hypothetical protein
MRYYFTHSLEPAMPEEMHNLFSHIPPVHDERVSRREYHEIQSTLYGRSIDTDLPVVWPRNKPGPNWV